VYYRTTTMFNYNCYLVRTKLRLVVVKLILINININNTDSQYWIMILEDLLCSFTARKYLLFKRFKHFIKIHL